MNTELEITNRELSDLQNLYSSDTEKYKKRINELLKQLDDARKYESTTKIDEQLNMLSEFNELKSRYEQIIIEHEASISKLNEEHADVIAVKDNLIRCLQREKEDLSNQFTDFKKEAQNTLDTVQQHLLNTREEIVSIVNENNNLNVSNVKRSQQIDSIIISVSHLPQISDWIKGNPDDDGYAPGTFHRWCDDYGAPTLIVIKLTDSCQIIGGYNCFSWKSPLIFATTQHDEHAFIFSLCDKDGNREKAKIARPKRIKKNHYNSKKGSFDLQLQNRLCYCKQRDYDDSITDHSGLFEFDDFEIF
ncbi:16060_t:CDS:2, partial [Racocetra fulgida]